MNPSQIAILFLIGYSILITIAFIIKSAKLRKHEALFNVEWIEYPKTPTKHGFKTLSDQMLEDAHKRIQQKIKGFEVSKRLCPSKICTSHFDANLERCPACLTKII